MNARLCAQSIYKAAFFGWCHKLANQRYYDNCGYILVLAVYTGFIRRDVLKKPVFEEEHLVGTKIRSKGFGASIRLGAILALLSAGCLQADYIWQNNNPINGQGGFWDSNTNVALTGNLQWTAFDNFTTPTAGSGLGWVINSLDFTDYLVHAPSGSADVTNTTWSIWSGDPLKNAGTLVATGTASVVGGNEKILAASGAGPCSAATCAYTFTISGLNVVLSAGTQYYFGRTNSVTQDGSPGQPTSTFPALTSPLANQTANWETASGNINGKNFDVNGANTSIPVGTSDTQFDIIGTVTPEPSTWALMGIAIAGFYLIRRRRIA
jgi:hypothetical protein